MLPIEATAGLAPAPFRVVEASETVLATELARAAATRLLVSAATVPPVSVPVFASATLTAAPVAVRWAFAVMSALVAWSFSRAVPPLTDGALMPL